MKRVVVHLTEEQVVALQELARLKNVSISQMVRESVAHYVATSDKTIARDEVRRRAIEFIRRIRKGEFQSNDIEGKTDVARNHDHYLTEAYSSWKQSS